MRESTRRIIIYTALLIDRLIEHPVEYMEAFLKSMELQEHFWVVTVSVIPVINEHVDLAVRYGFMFCTVAGGPPNAEGGGCVGYGPLKDLLC